MTEHIVTLAMAEGVEAARELPLTARVLDEGIEFYGAVHGPRYPDQSPHVATVPAGSRPEHTQIHAALNVVGDIVGEFRVEPSGAVNLTPRKFAAYYLFPRTREWFASRKQVERGETPLTGEVVAHADFPDRAFPHTRPEGSDASMFLQWKGTDVCLDFDCRCGASGHLDGYFAYAVRCTACGTVYELGTQVIAKAVDADKITGTPLDIVTDEDD